MSRSPIIGVFARAFQGSLMSATTRLAALTAVCVPVAGLVIPLSVAPMANADPCPISTASAQSRSASPSILSQLPNLHLPTGRKPTDADEVSQT